MNPDKQTIQQKLIDQGYQQAITVILPHYGVVLHTGDILKSFWLLDAACGPEVVVDIDALTEILDDIGIPVTRLSRKTYREPSLVYKQYETNNPEGLYAKIENGVLNLVTLYGTEDVPLRSTHGGEFHVFWKSKPEKAIL